MHQHTATSLPLNTTNKLTNIAFHDYKRMLPCFSFSLSGSVLYTRNPFSIPQAKHPGETHKNRTHTQINTNVCGQ